MADSNDEALPLLLPPGKKARGRPRKERRRQELCRAKGRFVRCPSLGARPPTLRAHRRVCGVNEPITCPRGATLIRDPPGPKGEYGMSGRKQACLLVPPPGSHQPARFVPATCASRKGTLARRDPGLFTPAPARAASARATPRAKRGPKVRDWSKCRCAPGLKAFKLASGALKCRDQATSKFVRAVCDEEAYSAPAPAEQAPAASRRAAPKAAEPKASKPRPKPTAAQRPMPSKFKGPRPPRTPS